MYSYIYSITTATAWLQGGGSERTNQHQHPKEHRITEPTWPTQRSNLQIFEGVCLRDVSCDLCLWEERLQLRRRTCLSASYTEESPRCTQHLRRKRRRVKRDRAGTVLRGHFDGAFCCVSGAGGVSALWQCVGGAAAPDAVCGADAGGRVSPGANQPGHTSCGHVAHPLDKILEGLG